MGEQQKKRKKRKKEKKKKEKKKAEIRFILSTNISSLFVGLILYAGKFLDAILLPFLWHLRPEKQTIESNK